MQLCQGWMQGQNCGSLMFMSRVKALSDWLCARLQVTKFKNKNDREQTQSSNIEVCQSIGMILYMTCCVSQWDSHPSFLDYSSWILRLVRQYTQELLTANLLLTHIIALDIDCSRNIFSSHNFAQSSSSRSYHRPQKCENWELEF